MIRDGFQGHMGLQAQGKGLLVACQCVIGARYSISTGFLGVRVRLGLPKFKVNTDWESELELELVRDP
jgi:hypothetical protein